MFQLNNKKRKCFNIFCCILILLCVCSFSLICFAESKIILNKTENEIKNGPNTHDYKIIENLFSGTKALIDEKNNMILHTTSSKDEMGFLYDNVTGEKRFVFIMTPQGAALNTPDKYERYGLSSWNYEIYDKYVYYDFNGKQLNIEDEKMFKIDYLIDDYMIYNTWVEKEPEMKAYKIDTKKIVSLGNYNYLSVVDDKIVLSKDVYTEFYSYGHWQRNNDSEEGTYTLGNTKMLICDKNFNKIKEIDKYAYLGKSKFKTKTYHKVYSLDSRNDYPENPLINFLDEDFNLVLDMPAFENAEAYEEIDKRLPDIVCEVYENINGENKKYHNEKDTYIKDTNIKAHKVKGSNQNKDIYTMKDFVKTYDYDFEKKEIVSIIDGKILSEDQKNTYEISEEYGRYTSKNGAIRLLKCQDGKYRLYDRYYNLIYEKEIEDPTEGFICNVSDDIENTVVRIGFGKEIKTIVFDKDYHYRILEDEFKNIYDDFSIGCGEDGYFYVKENDKNIYNIHKLNSDKKIIINSDIDYEKVVSISMGNNKYIKLKHKGFSHGDLFDLNGKLLYENFLESFKTSLKNKKNIDIYHLRLSKNEVYCDENLNVIIQFDEENKSFKNIVEKNGKTLYIARFDYKGKNKKGNSMVGEYCCLYDSDFNVITTNCKPNEEYVKRITAYDYDECVEVVYDDYKKYYGYDGKELIGFTEEKIKSKNKIKEESQNIKILDNEFNLKKEPVEEKHLNGSTLYNKSGKKICSVDYIIPFDDGSFIVQGEEKIVYYDKDLNKKEILSGNYSIRNCRAISYINIKDNSSFCDSDDVSILPLNKKPAYYIFGELKYNGRYCLLDKDFNIILSDFKGLSECDEKYVNYLYGFKYGLYDIDKKEFVNAYTIFDNFDDDEYDFRPELDY